MDKLPHDIIFEIKEYVSPIILYTTSMSNFNKYYRNIIQNYSLKDKEYLKYIIDIVKKDCILQFDIILNENYKLWLNTKRWIYKNIAYLNYLQFLNFISINNNSIKCKMLLRDKLNTSNKKKYKQKKKNKVWSN